MVAAKVSVVAPARGLRAEGVAPASSLIVKDTRGAQQPGLRGGGLDGQSTKASRKAGGGALGRRMPTAAAPQLVPAGQGRRFLRSFLLSCIVHVSTGGLVALTEDVSG